MGLVPWRLDLQCKSSWILNDFFTKNYIKSYALLLAPAFACFSFVSCTIAPFSYVAFPLGTFWWCISFYISVTHLPTSWWCACCCVSMLNLLLFQCYVYFYVLILHLLLCFSVANLNSF
jgi:hypothetical protein